MTAEATAQSDGGGQRARRRDAALDRQELKRRVAMGLMGSWRLMPLLIALVGIWIFFDVENSLFLSSRNLTNLTNQVAVSTLLALGLVFILIVRQVDISLAALSAVAGGVAADLVVEHGWNVVLAIGIALAFGAGVSLIQCVVVTRFAAPSFIVTLGGMFVLSAALLWLLPVTQVIPLTSSPLQGIAGSYLPNWLSYLLGGIGVGGFGLLRWSVHRARTLEGTASSLLWSTLAPTAVLGVFIAVALAFVFNAYLGVPTPAVIVVGVATVLAYIATQTSLGRHIYAIGGSPEAARRAGIRVGLVTAVAFGIGGLLAALAGIVNASRSLGVSAQSTDLTLLLVALAAVVIGGVSLFGGRGSVWAAVIGGVMLGSIQNGLQLMSTTLQVQWTVEGLVLVLAVVVDSAISRSVPNLE
jgi:D-xylose transport system permease protein